MTPLNRAAVVELHFITPLSNLPSILANGVLSNERSAQVAHASIAMAAVQERRARKELPNRKRLHSYANLYFHARNPMLYVRRGEHASLIVLRIDPTVLDLPGVQVTDQNAASDYVRFREARLGLDHVDASLVFAEYWTSPDPIEKFRRTAARCAEVLVPDVVPPKYILGGYVSCAEAKEAARQLAPSLAVAINRRFFFL